MNLPLFIQRRLYPFRKYVNDVLFPASQIGYLLKDKNKEEKEKILKNIKQVIDECSFVCFIFSLKQLFEEGTKSASEAVKIFGELGVNKFYIGKKDYSENNNNVLEGEKLYKTMLNSITDEKLKGIIENSSYYSQIIDLYKNVSI
jgi:hypothetical protein